jgi:hypothetical protein
MTAVEQVVRRTKVATDTEETMMLEKRIRSVAPPGTIIPKPQARKAFRVKGDGTRRGRPALIYTIPNHSDPARPYEKGVTYGELERAYAQLQRTGTLTTTWFKTHLPDCYAEGSCNFTTVGGLFELLGEAAYEQRGMYAKQ